MTRDCRYTLAYTQVMLVWGPLMFLAWLAVWLFRFAVIAGLIALMFSAY